jgi:hypothetical protein
LNRLLATVKTECKNALESIGAKNYRKKKAVPTVVNKKLAVRDIRESLNKKNAFDSINIAFPYNPYFLG